MLISPNLLGRSAPPLLRAWSRQAAAAAAADSARRATSSTASSAASIHLEANRSNDRRRRRRRRRPSSYGNSPSRPSAALPSFAPHSSSSFSSASRSTVPSAAIDTTSRSPIDSNPLHPPPDDDSLHRNGLPLLVRAAHHASLNRILCYDTYVHHHDRTRRPISDGGGGTAENNNSRSPSNNEKKKRRTNERKKKRKKVAYTYGDVLNLSARIHQYLLSHRILSTLLDLYPARTKSHLQTSPTDPTPAPPPPRVAFLCHPGPVYVACQWAAWSSGGIAVPLCTVHRRGEFEHVLGDCEPELIVDGVSFGVDDDGVDGDHGDWDGDGGGDPSGEGGELRAAAESVGSADRLVHVRDVLGWSAPPSKLGRGEDDDQAAAAAAAAAEAAAENSSGRGVNDELTPLPPAQHALGQSGLIPSLSSPALLLYTSGTTGKPKGVVLTHANLYHQVTDLVTSWGWNSQDSILHMLPLHHVHGVVNKLGCAAWVGASVEFMRFHPVKVWERLGVRFDPASDRSSEAKHEEDEHDEDDGEDGLAECCGAAVEARRPPTLLMAVPTIYAKMLEVLPTLPPQTLPDALSATLQSTIRLTVSGSAALPTTLFRRWKDATGHTMLERYGMTEFAMALSNPLSPKEGRLPGYVGLPLPSVDVKIVDEDTGEVIPNATVAADDVAADDNDSAGTDGGDDHATATRSGELCVKGPTVFAEYWNRPHATAESFDFDGYFKTGDVAEYDPRPRKAGEGGDGDGDGDGEGEGEGSSSSSEGSYHILGRVSADIIKSGGHKLSSLQIERALLEHPRLAEAVVLGVPDETYGERVGLICRMKEGDCGGGAITLNELKEWCWERMAPYKIPTRLVVVEDDVPKNAMGKVSKKQLVSLF